MTSLHITPAQITTLARQHYENFPVVPFFMPKNFRKEVALIYAFARIADDIADEGNATSSQRLQQLQHMHDRLPDRDPKPNEPLFKDLNPLITQRQLPCQLFHDLLDAFMQDVHKSNYLNFEELLAYCSRSANPIGRLLLHLTNQASVQNLIESDAICSALQLINFLQDWDSDLKQRNRLYIPLSDLKDYNLDVSQLQAATLPNEINLLLERQWQRAHHLLHKGSPLAFRLKGRFGFKIRLTMAGGATILKKCHERINPRHRPVLEKLDWVQIIFKALCKKSA